MSGGSGVVHRIVARTLRKRNDPHGKLIVDPSILKGVEIDNAGIVELWIKPSNPHCPCCLDDLIDLRSLLKKQRGVLACHIEIVGIPQSDRWTAAINE
jgi:metal-sulfur cluster biosynthetic enzyme